MSENPREANMEGGIFPAILFGTFVMTVLMSMAVMPFGVVAAIYLREYAKQGIMVRSVHCSHAFGWCTFNCIWRIRSRLPLFILLAAL